MKRTTDRRCCRLAMFSGAALAAEAEGQIQSIDKDKLTITLSDGNPTSCRVNSTLMR